MLHFSCAGVLNIFPVAASKSYSNVIFYKQSFSLAVKILRWTLYCLPANAEEKKKRNKPTLPKTFGMKLTPEIYRGLVLCGLVYRLSMNHFLTICISGHPSLGSLQALYMWSPASQTQILLYLWSPGSPQKRWDISPEQCPQPKTLWTIFKFLFQMHRWTSHCKWSAKSFTSIMIYVFNSGKKNKVLQCSGGQNILIRLYHKVVQYRSHR